MIYLIHTPKSKHSGYKNSTHRNMGAFLFCIFMYFYAIFMYIYSIYQTGVKLGYMPTFWMEIDHRKFDRKFQGFSVLIYGVNSVGYSFFVICACAETYRREKFCIKLHIPQSLYLHTPNRG